MVETPNPNDQAARIRQLQERRAASGPRHPAAATRILLAGLSVASFFSVAGAIALTHRSTSAAQTVSPVNPAKASAPASAAARPGAPGNGAALTTTKAS